MTTSRVHAEMEKVENPLDSVKSLPLLQDESPFYDYKTLTGFDSDAWMKSVHPDPAPVESYKIFNNQPTQTIYDLITSSDTTSELAKLVSEHPGIVSILESLDANYTLFAPTNAAIQSIAEHIKQAPKGSIENVLRHHISQYKTLASYILISPTLPIIYESPTLNGELRLHFSLDSKGVEVNYDSHIIAFDISATNGVIHVVDKVILPPPQALQIIQIFPSEFSIFCLGLQQTGLASEISADGHVGITIFAPRNSAFLALGAHVNAFLFSKDGNNYFRALLQYHIVSNKTLWSNAFSGAPRNPIRAPASDFKDVVNSDKKAPRGIRKFPLPTMLEGENINVTINREAQDITLHVNDIAIVAVVDGIAADGVVHAMNDVLIPNWPHAHTPTLFQLKEILQLMHAVPSTN